MNTERKWVWKVLTESVLKGEKAVHAEREKHGLDSTSDDEQLRSFVTDFSILFTFMTSFQSNSSLSKSLCLIAPRDGNGNGNALLSMAFSFNCL